MSKFESGTVVRLKSGGLDMVVNQALRSGVECVWHDVHGAPHRETFTLGVLVLAESPDGQSSDASSGEAESNMPTRSPRKTPRRSSVRDLAGSY